ncbi:MAG: hypothetical protein GYA24_16805 [Candidatus Lokiarchaeota archaeon]|nr:hypothetical protein [Candidatus Lokiarchaeota archaeon]
MEPFYAWQTRHDAGNLPKGIVLAEHVPDPSMARLDSRQVTRQDPARRFKQLTLIDAVCSALLS